MTKTTIKFIDSDLVLGKVTLMVGSLFRTITASEYMILRGYANKWQSGLEHITRKTHCATVLVFNEAHACNLDGYAMARNIKKLLGL